MSEPFFTTNPGGLGSIVEAHGGRLSVAAAERGEGNAAMRATLDCGSSHTAGSLRRTAGPMTAAPTVFVVDDSVAVRRSLNALLRAAKFEVETYASCREFLTAYDPRRSGCLLIDLWMRGEDGLDLIEELRRRESPLPIIVLTGHGTVAASVRALKAGVVDFLEKPAPPATLLARIREALDLSQWRQDTELERKSVERRAARLTQRERQVTRLLLLGKRSKDIAEALGVSARTVEGYRSSILLKMGVSSAAELIGILLRTNVVPRT